MSPTPTQPVAKGALSSTPFAHLVLYIYQRRSSGTLVVRGPQARSSSRSSQQIAIGEPVAVLFHRGRAVAARIPSTGDTLDQALLPLCARREGEYEFFEEDMVGSGPSIVTGMFDPFAFVTEAARRHTPETIVDEVLARFADAPLCVQPGMDLDRLLLRPNEAAFAEVLRDGTATMGTLLGSSQMPKAAARRVLYALLVTKVVGPFAPTSEESRTAPQSGGVPSGIPVGKSSDAPASSGSPSRNSQLTPEQRRRQSSAAWAAIAARASQASRPLSGPIQPRSPSPMPGRSLTPPTAATRGATPVPGRSLTPAPAKKTSQPTAAVNAPLRSVTPPGAFGVRRTPMVPESPAAPPGRVVSDKPLEGSPSGVARGATPSRPISRVTPRQSSEPLENLDNEGLFRRVQQMVARSAFDEALPIIRGLVEQERRNPAYLGMLASVLYGQGTEGTISKEIVDTVNQALRIHPDEVNALYTKARCYKRMGKNREALHYFRRTVSVDPAHLDATREVRLLLLRQNDSKGKR